MESKFFELQEFNKYDDEGDQQKDIMNKLNEYQRRL